MTKRKVKKKETVLSEYDSDLMKDLRNPEIAYAFLKDSLEDTDSLEFFLLALREVAEAHGMSHISRITSLNRVNLYRMLSKNGNPELNSLDSILQALGFKISIEWREAS